MTRRGIILKICPIIPVKKALHRLRSVGEESLEEIKICGTFHRIGERVIIREYDPKLIFSGEIVDIYYKDISEPRIIIERKSGCNIIWYRIKLSLSNIEPEKITMTSEALLREEIQNQSPESPDKV